jgi:hypothetical protein
LDVLVDEIRVVGDGDIVREDDGGRYGVGKVVHWEAILQIAGEVRVLVS